MNTNTLTEFKNEVLFSEIRMTERSRELFDLCSDGTIFYKQNTEIETRRVYPYKRIDSAYILFLQLAGSVLKRKSLIELCADLKRNANWKDLSGSDQTDTYYEDYFQDEINAAKVLMKKLRPLVLKESALWTAERKQSDLNKPEGVFMKHWYLTTSVVANKSIKMQH